MDLTALAHHLRRVTVGLSSGARGMGSGVIWAPGLIVTNAHVVRAPRIGVRGVDGQQSEGVVIARDDEADLAVLSAPALGLSAAMSSTDPYRPRVGSIVVAVGHPFGIPGALTMGVVHAVAPITPGGRTYLQADLQLAPGNSGGPLADAEGHVLGVNAMMLGALALAILESDVRRFLRRAGVCAA
jgi:serine protease Do